MRNPERKTVEDRGGEPPFRTARGDGHSRSNIRAVPQKKVVVLQEK